MIHDNVAVFYAFEYPTAPNESGWSFCRLDMRTSVVKSEACYTDAANRATYTDREVVLVESDASRIWVRIDPSDLVWRDRDNYYITRPKE